MIALHLLRHADAGDPAAWDGPDDLRPLSPKGRRQAARLAGHLAAAGYTVDVILTSPRVRAVETAEILGDALGLEPVMEPRLAEPLGPSDLTAILAEAGNPGRPVLVGHDPDFSDLLTLLTGVRAVMRKGALARLDLALPVEPGAAQLAALLPPELLPRQPVPHRDSDSTEPQAGQSTINQPARVRP